MERYSRPLYLFILLGLFTQSAFSLKCYVCNTESEADCSASPTPEKYLITCSLENIKKRSETNDSDASASLPTPSPSSSTTVTPTPNSNNSEVALNRTARMIEGLVSVDPFTVDGFLPKSDSEFTFCRKNTYQIPLQNNGPSHKQGATTRIVRSCGWIPGGGDSKSKRSGCKRARDASGKGHSTKGVIADLCECTGDKCNSGNSIGSLAVQSFVLMVLSTGYQYMV